MRGRAIPLLIVTLLGPFGFIGLAHATLIGDTITDTEIFGTTVVQVNGPSVVPVTFSIRAGPAASIAVGGTTITYSFLEDGVYTSASFNGSVFDLSVPFSGAAIDASNTTVPGVSNADISILSGDLFVNLAGVRFSTGQEIVIDVATAVPEPSSLALLVVGFLSLGALVRSIRN